MNWIRNEWVNACMYACVLRLLGCHILNMTSYMSFSLPLFLFLATRIRAIQFLSSMFKYRESGSLRCECSMFNLNHFSGKSILSIGHRIPSFNCANIICKRCTENIRNPNFGFGEWKSVLVNAEINGITLWHTQIYVLRVFREFWVSNRFSKAG